VLHLCDGIMSALVDSGASTSVFTDESGMEEQLIKKQRSDAVFCGMENGREVRGKVEGTACMWVFDPENVDGGSGLSLNGTIVPGMRSNLISVSHVCEQHGFTQVIRPSYEGESGFYKVVEGGKVLRLPIVLDRDRGLYVAYYTIAASIPAAREAARKMDVKNITKPYAGQGDTLQLVENKPVQTELESESQLRGMNRDAAMSFIERNGGGVGALITADTCHEIHGPMTVVDAVRSGDEDDRQLEAYHGSNADVSFGDPVEKAYAEMESVLAKSHRSGLKKLTKEQLHRKLGHLGHFPRCKTCQQLRAKRRLFSTGSRQMDYEPGRTFSLDSIYWSNRSLYGDKYTVAGRDEMTGWLFAYHMELRSTAGDQMIEMVKRIRSDPEINNPNAVRRIYLDPAGEWSAENKEFQRKWAELQPPVELVYRHTAADKRFNAHGEVTMRVIEEVAKAIMLDTRLEVEMWPFAVDHAVFILNLTTMSKKCGPDGHGPRPLQEMSRWHISVDECDRRLENSVPPGTLCYVRIAHAPKGSNVADMTRYRWGRALRMEKSTVVFQDPWKRHVTFKAYKDFETVDLPAGQSALGFLGIQLGGLPKAAYPRKGDAEENESTAVIRIDGLSSNDALPIASSLTANGKNPTPGVIVIDEHNRIYEPSGEDNVLRPTSGLISIVDGDEPIAAVNDTTIGRDRLKDYLTYMPQFFVGRSVFKSFEATSQTAEGVFKGTVQDWEKQKKRPDHNVFRVLYPDGFTEDFDHEDMMRWGIEQSDGSVPTGGGIDVYKMLKASTVAQGAGGSVPVTAEQTAIRDAAGSGDVGVRADQHNNAGGSLPISVPVLSEPVLNDYNYYWTQENDGWDDLCEAFGLDDIDKQQMYFDWLKKEHKIGNNMAWKDKKKHPDAYYFPNPIRQRTKGRNAPKAISFRADSRFPMPMGLKWDAFVSDKSNGNIKDHGENVEFCNHLTELENDEAEYQVWTDYCEVKRAWDSDDIDDWKLQQVHLAELADERDLNVKWAQVDDKQYFEKKTGLPIAPTSVKALHKRLSDKKLWTDAIEKENQGLKDRGVFKYMTLKKLIEGGHVTNAIRPIPMRMLLNTKITPEGDFDKAKARAVLQGDPRHMQKGVHFSVVFAPSPGLGSTRMLQAYAVGENKARFGFDVNQAFLHADSTEGEQLPVRFAEGCREYDENGEEIYGLLVKNIYGSPLASRNWSIHRNKFMLDIMGKEEGWKVTKMLKEPCMFRVEIEGRVSFMVVHTDDVDGVCDDPRDGKAIYDKFDKEFGVTSCDPKHMLGVTRQMREENGIVISRHTQVAYIEEVWEKFKHFRGGQKAPKTPADDLKFTDENGRLIVVKEDEYEQVKARGYRQLIGCLLWPARNAYPMISFAVTQLCRCMEKPSERAWESALYTLHYLYETREIGIGYRSDGDPIPRCWYDSGHMQDRSDYRNQYGVVLTWFGGPIHWMSKKHQHVGESSAEDEYMALNHAYKLVKWFRDLLVEMGLGHYVEEPTLLAGDNKQAGRWSRDDMITNGNRFIERMYFKVREGIEAGDVETRYINTKLNCSDPFTKAVSKEVVEICGAMIAGLAELPEIPECEDKLKRL